MEAAGLPKGETSQSREGKRRVLHWMCAEGLFNSENCTTYEWVINITDRKLLHPGPNDNLKMIKNQVQYTHMVTFLTT